MTSVRNPVALFTKFLFCAVASLAMSAMSGCNGAPPTLFGDPAATGSTADMTVAPTPDLAMVAYPAGPYGNQMGDTMADFTLAGYRLSPTQQDSSKLTWDTTIKLSDLHANPACKCVLISVGASWCGNCQAEQPTLITDVGNDPSFCVLGVLQEGLVNGTPAVQSDVDTWTQQYMQNFYVAMGDHTTNDLYNGWAMNGIVGLPFNLIVETQGMTVVGNVQGYEPTIHDHAMMLCNGGM